MACLALSAALKGKVFFHNNAEYRQSTNSYFSALENELKPACIVRPQCTEDVATILKVIKPFALEGKIKIAIRGGGHTPWAGAANIHDGVTIDMENITGVHYDPRTNITKIGSGERWKNVYSTLGEKDLAVTGGRVSKVGVAGLTLGGGLSYHSSARGFACDNVVNYQVVLASGDTVEVNEESYADLFKALRGGSNNFGIVTRFDMRTFPQGQMWGGLISYPFSAFSSLAEAFINFSNTSLPDSDAHIIAAASFFQGTEVAVANFYHAKPEASPPSLEPFIKIQPQFSNSVRNDSLLGFAEEQSAFCTGGHRSWFFTTSWHADLNLMKAVRAVAAEIVKTLTSSVPSFVLALAFQPLTKGLLGSSEAAGGNSLGLTPNDGPLIVNMLQSQHADPADDGKVISAMLALVKSIEKLATENGKFSRFKFMNYSYPTQSTIASYGPESVLKLEAVSRKYDPNGFFQSVVPGGYKLPAP